MALKTLMKKNNGNVKKKNSEENVSGSIISNINNILSIISQKTF